MNDEKKEKNEETSEFQKFVVSNAGKKELIKSIIRDVLKASENPEFNQNTLEKFDFLNDLIDLLE